MPTQHQRTGPLCPDGLCRTSRRRWFLRERLKAAQSPFSSGHGFLGQLLLGDGEETVFGGWGLYK